MVPRIKLFWPSLFTIMMSAASFCGCQHFQPAANPQWSLTKNDEKATKLTGGQVADVKVAMGRALEKRGDTAQAATAYREALKQDPARADASLRLAILHDQAGHFEKSLEFYQKALVAQPGSPDIYCDMGYSLYLQRRWPEAAMNLRQAVTLAPDHQRAHNNLGLVLAHMGRGEEALLEFRRAGCNEADALINLAFVHTLENRLAEAKAHYELALAKDASSAAAKEGLHELSGLMTRLDPANRESLRRQASILAAGASR
jgi:Tfp pilus assembly protein PilF